MVKSFLTVESWLNAINCYRAKGHKLYTPLELSELWGVTKQGVSQKLKRSQTFLVLRGPSRLLLVVDLVN